MFQETMISFLLIFLLVNLCSCSDLYSDKVLKYDSETFKKNIGGNIPHFVNFFAPWCGYCKRLKPVWDELAEKYNKDSSQQEIVIAKVDCTAETPICAEEDVSGYPSLIFYDVGEKKGIKYQGKRDLLGLEEFISNNLKEEKKSIPPPSLKMSPGSGAIELTDENFHQVVDYGLHFVKFFAPWCGHCQRMAGTWEELAISLQHDKSIKIAKVDCTAETPICAEEDVSGYPSLIFYDVGEKKGIKYQGKRDLLGLEEFISNNLKEEKKSIPPPSLKMSPGSGAIELTDENFHQVIDYGMHFVKFFAPWCGHCQRMAGTWEELAISLQHDKSIKIAKVDCTVNKMACTEFEVKGFPTLLFIINGKKVEKYQGDRNLDGFKKFISEMKAAHLDAIEAEEGKIESNQEQPNVVVELSADNFENAIADGFSFVKFYVPWCGHSKRLAPIWNDLGQKFVLHTRIKIAKVDCTQDEMLCSEHKVVGYPSLFVFRNGKFVTEYHGPRKLDQLHSFVLDHLHHTEL
ncbi:thioredoxin domain-containing protein 5 [Parasteatoda tepidariorum]|uniref:thioredoxin domain-containing protein 5 n=1 Tax=Parasteatoda tepidariorum TaxID=114398 RepID=UPI0039BD1738